jgi:hypothetical protein
MADAWPIIVVLSLAAPLLAEPGVAQGTRPNGAGEPGGEPAALCIEAARLAEQRYRLPAGLLSAIALVESGRPVNAQWRIEPWPWTVQSDAKSFFFDSKRQAVRWTMDAMARGVRSIDTGCLQVNLFFHPDAFQTIDDAFDPGRNADYAARFLLRLYAESGDWRTAAGYYHSKTTVLAKPYEDQVERRMSAAGVHSVMPLRAGSLLTQLAEAWRHTMTFGGMAERTTR